MCLLVPSPGFTDFHLISRWSPLFATLSILFQEGPVYITAQMLTLFLRELTVAVAVTDCQRELQLLGITPMVGFEHVGSLLSAGASRAHLN
jgi:hypothetical protein